MAQLFNVLNQGGAVETQLEYATHVVLCRDVTSLYANLNPNPSPDPDLSSRNARGR